MSANDWQKVTAALAAVEMESFAERQIGELSGGQFQRVLIARTLVQDANHIFLDEPFVGIDATSEAIIVGLLRNLRDAGKTILSFTMIWGKSPNTLITWFCSIKP